MNPSQGIVIKATLSDAYLGSLLNTQDYSNNIRSETRCYICQKALHHVTLNAIC